MSARLCSTAWPRNPGPRAAGQPFGRLPPGDLEPRLVSSLEHQPPALLRHVPTQRSNPRASAHIRYRPSTQLHRMGATEDRLGRDVSLFGLPFRWIPPLLGISLDPAALNTQLFSSFIQDKLAIVPDRLSLTFGAKLEHNHYTGFGPMPSARMAWILSSQRAPWAAFSKTERNPSELRCRPPCQRRRVSRSWRNSGLPDSLRQSERRQRGVDRLRNRAIERWSRRNCRSTSPPTIAATCIRNTNEPSTPFLVDTPPPYLILPLTTENLMHRETHGTEIAVNWKPPGRWILSPGYAFEQIHMHLAPTSQDTTSVTEAQGSTPVNAAQLRAHLDLAVAYRGTHLPISWTADRSERSLLIRGSTPGYRGRSPERINLSLVGQDLLRDRHREFVDPTGSTKSTLIKRSGYAKVEWRF